ncbi:HCP-like protein [Dissophora ornata]|nr:HCP-like protein [Dissophora ornata]
MGPPARINGAAAVAAASATATAAGAGAGAGPPQRRSLTIEVLDAMRQRAKDSNDPSAQLEYAKALIEAAVTFGNDDPDPKRQKKNKEALFLEGLKIIKRLASTGVGIGKPAYPDAQFFLANCYGNGSLGLEIDHDKAFNLYTQASKQNHPAATYRTGVCYELGAGTKRDHNRAVQFYRKAAALGDTAAMYKSGMILLKGLLGLQSNPREAITWFKRAAANADEDNPHALHELGLCFEKAGIPSVIPDEAYSRELFTQAAGYSYAPSQFKLGHCYEYGTLTCPVDPRRSIAWYTRAAEQGDPESELGLSGWYLTGAEGVLKQSDTEAYLWARKAADKGLARGEYAVGYYSEVGIGVKQDLEESRRWYLRSAAQGNNRAKKRLTDMKKMGAIRRGRHDRARQSGQQGPEDENCKVM